MSSIFSINKYILKSFLKKKMFMGRLFVHRTNVQKTRLWKNDQFLSVDLVQLKHAFVSTSTACDCNHVGNNCDANTGQCICPPNTIGERCDRCAPNHWGHDIVTGCKVRFLLKIWKKGNLFESRHPLFNSPFKSSSIFISQLVSEWPLATERTWTKSL